MLYISSMKKYNKNYSVTEEGKVYSHLNNRFISTTLNNNTGYIKVVLFNNGKRYDTTIHRIIAETYIPNPDNKPCVNHIDGNKLNNSVNNLEWVTYSENTIHGFSNGLIKPRGQSISDELKNKIISLNGKLSQRKIATKLNTTFSIVNTTLKNYNLCLS